MFNTDLQIMFGMLKYRKDKVLLAKYIEENQSYFASVEEDALNAILSLLSSSGTLAEKLEHLWETRDKEEIKNMNGGFDVCKALKDMMDDSYKAGEIMGAIRMCREFKISKEDATRKMVEKFNLTECEAKESVEKYWV